MTSKYDNLIKLLELRRHEKVAENDLVGWDIIFDGAVSDVYKLIDTIESKCSESYQNLARVLHLFLII